jgi:hypothetical protein
VSSAASASAVFESESMSGTAGWFADAARVELDLLCGPGGSGIDEFVVVVHTVPGLLSVPATTFRKLLPCCGCVLL